MLKRNLCTILLFTTFNAFGEVPSNITTTSSSNNFCTDLGDSLAKKYENRIINNNIFFKYTSVDGETFSRLVSYFIDYNYDINSESYILKNCVQHSQNYAVYTINRNFPLTRINTHEVGEGPNFEIQFSNFNGNWKVTNVLSRDCNEKIYVSLKTEFEERFNKNRVIVPSNFYSNLKSQVEKEECPAHSNLLSATISKLL